MRRILMPLLVLLIVFQIACASTGTQTKTPPSNPISVSVSPASANVRLGASQTFTATVTNSSNQNVAWSVSGIAGGNATIGTVSASGDYSAPAALPNPNTISVQASAAADATATATSNVTLWNPMPTLGSVSPSAFTVGTFSLTINGSNFLSGSQFLFGGAALSTKFVSANSVNRNGIAKLGWHFCGQRQQSKSWRQHFRIDQRHRQCKLGRWRRRQSSSERVQRISHGQGASLNGFFRFPPDNAWNTNIASSPIDPNSKPSSISSAAASCSSGLRLRRI